MARKGSIKVPVPSSCLLTSIPRGQRRIIRPQAVSHFCSALGHDNGAWCGTALAAGKVLPSRVEMGKASTEHGCHFYPTCLPLRARYRLLSTAASQYSVLQSNAMNSKAASFTAVQWPMFCPKHLAYNTWLALARGDAQGARALAQGGKAGHHPGKENSGQRHDCLFYFENLKL